MPVEFNHTIVWSKDARKSARFLAEILGLPEPSRLYHCEVVTTANGVNVDFADAEGAIGTQHYAFLVSEPEFDAVFGRVRGRLLRTMDRGNWRRMPTLTASPGAMASRLQGTVPLRGMDASHSTQPCGGPEAAAG